MIITKLDYGRDGKILKKIQEAIWSIHDKCSIFIASHDPETDKCSICIKFAPILVFSDLVSFNQDKRKRDNLQEPSESGCRCEEMVRALHAGGRERKGRRQGGYGFCDLPGIRLALCRRYSSSRERVLVSI